MYIKKTNHDCCLVISKDMYNILMESLESNYLCPVNSISEQAQKLIIKIKKYCKYYENENGNEMVDIRFYKSEANDLIWQFITFSAKYSEMNKDYYSEHQMIRDKIINIKGVM